MLDALCRQDEDQNCANFAKYPCSCSARLLTTKTKRRKKTRKRGRARAAERAEEGGQIPIDESHILYTADVMAYGEQLQKYLNAMHVQAKTYTFHR